MSEEPYMTTTATKIAGEAMTDEQIIEMASRFAHSDGWLNGDGAIAFARALLARKPAVPVQDEIADGELIADLIEQNRSLRARLAAPASPSGEDAAEQAAAPMARSGEQLEALDDAYEKGYVDGWKNGPFRRAAPTAKQCAIPSVGAHLWMPAEIPEPTEVPADFGTREAYAFKNPGAGEHDPWYVVLPSAVALKLGYHADDAIDKAHAEFIAAAINRAMALPRASEQADEAVTDGVAHFNWLCSLMPEGFHWGEPLTPDVLSHIASAARTKEPK